MKTVADNSACRGNLLQPVTVWVTALLALGAWRTDGGTWTPLLRPAPDDIQLMLQLSDGTVMCFNNDRNWYQLTPDSRGSYVNGTWTTLSPMADTRTFAASQVLRDGRVFVAGGEYGTGTNTAEVYDPLADAWLTTPSSGQPWIGDAPSMLLPDGRVLLSPKTPSTRDGTVIYDPVSNSWTDGPVQVFGSGESSWLKLPDDSILTVATLGLITQRYVPSLNRWKSEGYLPFRLGNLTAEYGPGLLLPDGRAFFLGGTGHTALYTPSGNTNSGTWAPGPDIPAFLASADAPGAVLVSGNVLFVCSPMEPNTVNQERPISFFEFDPVAGTYTQQPSPVGGLTEDIACYRTAFLCLPDGNVLFADYTRQLYVYHPSGPPLAAAKPTILSVSWNGDGSLHLAGTRLNGLSAGAAYGDDLQMDSNYPLVRLTDGGGQVYYGRTFSWSSTSVATGTRVVSTEFTVPRWLSPGGYSLVVVANGIASDSVPFDAPIWVDFTDGGFFEFGTYLFPFSTLAQGVSAVDRQGTILFRSAGLSAERMTLSKPMTLVAAGGPVTIGR